MLARCSRYHCRRTFLLSRCIFGTFSCTTEGEDFLAILLVEEVVCPFSLEALGIFERHKSVWLRYKQQILSARQPGASSPDRCGANLLAREARPPPRRPYFACGMANANPSVEVETVVVRENLASWTIQAFAPKDGLPDDEELPSSIPAFQVGVPLLCAALAIAFLPPSPAAYLRSLSLPAPPRRSPSRS